MSGRLPTEIWVKAHGARCAAAGIPMVVVRRGDAHRGLVIVKLYDREAGVRVLTQIRSLDDDLVWNAALDDRWVPESEADEYIARQASYDPDLWVVELECTDEEGWFRGTVR